MQNGIIKGNGASRYLKTIPNASTLYPTYEDFILALTQGTFTIDFNGINESGWTQIGTELNKANLLSDETCALLELDATESVPDDALQSLYRIASVQNPKIATGSFTLNVVRNEALNHFAGQQIINHGIGRKPVLLMLSGGTTTSNKNFALFDQRGCYAGSYYKFGYEIGLDTDLTSPLVFDENNVTINWKITGSDAQNTTQTIYYTIIG